jgi:hypothetical protein
MKKIKTLVGLKSAALTKRAVIVPKSMVWGRKPSPAAFIINLSGEMLYRLFNLGIYLCPNKRRSK